MTDSLSYHHIQRGPLCWLLYAVAIVMIVLGLVLRNVPPFPWLFPLVGLLMMFLAAGFHYLKVKSQSDRLQVGFGPLPLFRRTVLFEDIVSASIGRTTFLDGWGIHMSLQGGWVWNLWGRDCVVLQLRNTRLRIGTDDAEQLVAFIREKIGSQCER
ncbi:MAG: hypothetical protein R3C20_22720 [Planctomycetaceae bacterium]